MCFMSFPIPLLQTLLTLYLYTLQASNEPLPPQIHFSSVVPIGSPQISIIVTGEPEPIDPITLSPGQEATINVSNLDNYVYFANATYGQNSAHFTAYDLTIDSKDSVYWRASNWGFEKSYDKDVWFMKTPWESM